MPWLYWIQIGQKCRKVLRKNGGIAKKSYEKMAGLPESRGTFVHLRSKVPTNGVNCCFFSWQYGSFARLKTLNLKGLLAASTPANQKRVFQRQFLEPLEPAALAAVPAV